MGLQYQIPGGPFIDDGQSGLEFQVPGGPFFNETDSGGAILTGSHDSQVIASVAMVPSLALFGADVVPATAGSASSALHARFGRPVADDSNSGWTSTEASLYEALDEHARDDASYIRATGAATARVALTQLDDPGPTLHAIAVASPAGYTPSGTLTVRLHSGAAQIAEWVIADLAADDVRVLELTGEQRDAISDYTALDLEFVASV